MFEQLLGKKVEVDGMYLGVIQEMQVTHNDYSFPVVSIKAILTKEVIENLNDYMYMYNIINGDTNRAGIQGQHKLQ